MHSLLSAATMAEFGMALPYFIEIVELKNTNILYGPRVAHSIIGQVFGEQAIIMTGIAPDGQTWQAIYPHETSDCWAMPQPYDTPMVLDQVVDDNISGPMHLSS
jgi:hypothetical protein